MTGVLIKKGNDVKTQIQEEHHRKVESEIGTRHLQAKEYKVLLAVPGS